MNRPQPLELGQTLACSSILRRAPMQKMSNERGHESRTSSVAEWWRWPPCTHLAHCNATRRSRTPCLIAVPLRRQPLEHVCVCSSTSSVSEWWRWPPCTHLAHCNATRRSRTPCLIAVPLRRQPLEHVCVCSASDARRQRHWVLKAQTGHSKPDVGAALGPEGTVPCPRGGRRRGDRP